MSTTGGPSCRCSLRLPSLHAPSLPARDDICKRRQPDPVDVCGVANEEVRVLPQLNGVGQIEVGHRTSPTWIDGGATGVHQWPILVDRLGSEVKELQKTADIQANAEERLTTRGVVRELHHGIRDEVMEAQIEELERINEKVAREQAEPAGEVREEDYLAGLGIQDPLPLRRKPGLHQPLRREKPPSCAPPSRRSHATTPRCDGAISSGRAVVEKARARRCENLVAVPATFLWRREQQRSRCATMAVKGGGKGKVREDEKTPAPRPPIYHRSAGASPQVLHLHVACNVSPLPRRFASGSRAPAQPVTEDPGGVNEACTRLPKICSDKTCTRGANRG